MATKRRLLAPAHSPTIGAVRSAVNRGRGYVDASAHSDQPGINTVLILTSRHLPWWNAARPHAQYCSTRSGTCIWSSSRRLAPPSPSHGDFIRSSHADLLSETPCHLWHAEVRRAGYVSSAASTHAAAVVSTATGGDALRRASLEFRTRLRYGFSRIRARSLNVAPTTNQQLGFRYQRSQQTGARVYRARRDGNYCIPPNLMLDFASGATSGRARSFFVISRPPSLTTIARARQQCGQGNPPPRVRTTKSAPPP